MVSHRNYRVRSGRSATAAPFRMPGAPFANWAVLGFLVVVSGCWRSIRTPGGAVRGSGVVRDPRNRYYARSRRVSLADAAR